jgi:hypothetical protein
MSRGYSLGVTANSHSQQNSLATGALPTMTQCSSLRSSTRDSARLSSIASDFEQQYILESEGGAAVPRPVQRVTVYECPFLFLGCVEWFYDADEWRSHAESHFGNYPPPNHAICCFCDMTFDDDDPNICWGHRMNHVAAHHIRGDRLQRCRPDYALMRYMYHIRQNPYDQTYALSQGPPVYGPGELVFGNNQQPVQPTPGYGGRPEVVINRDPRRGRPH